MFQISKQRKQNMSLLLLGLCAIGIVAAEPSRIAHPELYNIRVDPAIDPKLQESIVQNTLDSIVEESKKL